MTQWIQNTLTGFLRGDKGAAMIEFTLVAPLIIFLGLGAGEFGRALQHHHAINKGARDAARYLARVPATCGSAGIGNGWLDNGANETTAQYLAMTGYAATSTNWILPYWTQLSTVVVTVDCAANDTSLGIPYEGLYRKDAYIPSVNVAISVPYADIGFLSLFGVGAVNISATHSEPHIGE